MGENEWWGVGLGGGTRGPHKNVDFTHFFFKKLTGCYSVGPFFFFWIVPRPK